MLAELHLHKTTINNGLRILSSCTTKFRLKNSSLVECITNIDCPEERPACDSGTCYGMNFAMLYYV